METSVQPGQSPPIPTRGNKVAIILLLITLVLPLLGAGAVWLLVYRPRANAERSRRNVKQIMLAIDNHHDTHLSLPDGSIGPSTHRFSWRVELLPFVEQYKLYKQFRFDEPWDSEHNLKVASDMPDIYRSRWDPLGTTDAGYLHVEDPNAAFPTASSIQSGSDRTRSPKNRLANITDGIGNTIGVIEVANSGIHWAQPTDITLEEAVALLHKGKVLSPGTAEIRSNATLVGMMDTSVQNVPIGISAEVAKQLVERQDGKIIDKSALGWDKPRAR